MYCTAAAASGQWRTSAIFDSLNCCRCTENAVLCVLTRWRKGAAPPSADTRTSAVWMDRDYSAAAPNEVMSLGLVHLRSKCVYPPSTKMICPVVWLDRGDARNTTISASSSMVVNR